MHKLANHQRYPCSPLHVHACQIIFLYFFAITPSTAESVSLAKAKPQMSQDFIVSTNDGLVSVKATEASLKDITEGIGQALGMNVTPQIGDQEKVTVEFHKLSLAEALKRLNGNYAYTADGDDGKFVKLFVFSKGKSARASHGVVEASECGVERPASSAESFTFEFNPAEFVEQAR